MLAAPLVVAFLVAIYSICFYSTSGARYRSQHFGSDRAARIVRSLCSLAASILGVEININISDDQLHSSCFLGAASPHGALPVSQLILGAPAFRLDHRLKRLNMRLCAASVLFYIPLVREFLLLFGARDASKRTLMSLLAKGNTVAICPGGNYEMASSSHTHEAIYLQKRLGFIRLAMATGRPIRPIYCFGENQLFVTSSFLLPFRRWVAQRLRVGFPIYFGRFYLPYGPPLPTKTTLIVGDAVSVGDVNATPTEAEVEAVCERYLDEISRIWATNARAYLPKEAAENGLKIVRLGKGVVRHVKAL